MNSHPRRLAVIACALVSLSACGKSIPAADIQSLSPTPASSSSSSGLSLPDGPLPLSTITADQSVTDCPGAPTIEGIYALRANVFALTSCPTGTASAGAQIFEHFVPDGTKLVTVGYVVGPDLAFRVTGECTVTATDGLTCPAMEISEEGGAVDGVAGVTIDDQNNAVWYFEAN